MNLGAADFIVITAYLAGAVFVGLWAGRKDQSTDDYFVGGRSMPGWAVGISILGTCISSVTYVAYPGKAFSGDWQYLVQGLMLPVVLLFGGLFAARFYRRRVKTSVNEFIEQRFGPKVRVFSLVFLITSEIARVASIMYLFSLVVHAITGLDIVHVILALGVITIVYAVFGGIRGVIWTDVIQTLVLLLGGTIAVAVAAFQVPGGLGAILGEAFSADKLQVFDFSGGLSHDTFWVLALSGLVNYFYFLVGNQNQIQRYQCASSDREAVKATLIGALVSVPAWTLFMLVGTSLFIFYRHHPDPAVAALITSGAGDQVFPHFIATRLPWGVSGLLIAGLAGAAMSSLDSSMNAASTMAVTDVYRRFIRPDAPEDRALQVARALTLFWGVLGVAMALAMMRVGTFLDFYFKLVSLVIGAITGVFFLALVVRRAHERGVLAGIAAGVPVMVWGVADMFGLKSVLPAFPFHPIMVGVLTTAVVIGAGWTASLVIPPRKV